MKRKDFFTRLFFSGIAIAFLLEAAEGIVGKVQAAPSEKSKNELKPLNPFQLGLRLAGTILSGDGYAYALIVEESTGNQNMYTVGESVNGHTIQKISSDRVELKKEETLYVLKITGDGDTEIETPEEKNSLKEPPVILPEKLSSFEPSVLEKENPSRIMPEKLPPFKPLVLENGPPSIGESKELPYFEPVVTEHGPPSIGESKELPYFEPVIIGPDLSSVIPMDSEQKPSEK